MPRPFQLAVRAAIGLSVAGGAIGCSARPAAAPSASAEQMAKLRARSDDQTARIAELETRLALLEAEWRKSRVAERLKPAQTVVIGAKSGADPGADQSADQSAEKNGAPSAAAPRQRSRRARAGTAPPASEGTVRLVLEGQPDALMTAETPLAAESDLPGLGVVPLPGTAADDSERRPATPTGSSPKQQYLQALSLLQHQDYDRALVAFAGFLGAHPGHPLADRALYWRGEVEYALRDYARALASFDELATRFPNSGKRADALLKAGYCHRRLGDEGAARRYFRQVRNEFPDSEAARVASGEGAS